VTHLKGRDMEAIYIYVIPIWVYGTMEIFFNLRFKTKATRKQLDLTYFGVTIPAFSILFIPIIFTTISKRQPSRTSIIFYLSIFFAGMFIRYLGLRELRGLFSAKVELRKDHNIINSGIYGIIRHPLYLGTLVMSFAAVVFYVNILSMIMMGLLLIGIAIRVNKEEKYLQANLMGYSDYMKETKRLLPYIF
jgi:protein-S-isoprenylcysteine O-methyltransferase Ste14